MAGWRVPVAGLVRGAAAEIVVVRIGGGMGRAGGGTRGGIDRAAGWGDADLAAWVSVSDLSRAICSS